MKKSRKMLSEILYENGTEIKKKEKRKKYFSMPYGATKSMMN